MNKLSVARLRLLLSSWIFFNFFSSFSFASFAFLHQLHNDISPLYLGEEFFFLILINIEIIRWHRAFVLISVLWCSGYADCENTWATIVKQINVTPSLILSIDRTGSNKLQTKMKWLDEPQTPQYADMSFFRMVAVKSPRKPNEKRIFFPYNECQTTT